MTENDLLDYYRDILHYSVYKCSCGARLMGGPASYHFLMLKHTYERELFPWEREKEFQGLFD
jgi:hypothetical protein